MDRIDIHLWMHTVDPRKLVHGVRGESSEAVAQRVLRAREIQTERFKEESISTNAEMSGRLIKKYCRLDTKGNAFLEKLMTRMELSARACSRILKISRTIADLDGMEDINLSHLSEAAGLRFLDRTNV